MSMNNVRLPRKLYICPKCGYQTEYRFVLKNHLQAVHGYGKRDSAQVAMDSEYLLNPQHIRRYDLDSMDSEEEEL